MENETLAFFCSHCGTHLVVPLSAAGLEGPCPKCGMTIRSPQIPVLSVMPVDPPVKVEEPVRLAVTEDPKSFRIKAAPLAAVAQQPLVPSTAMASEKHSRRVMWFSLAVFVIASAIAGFAIYRYQKAVEPILKSSATLKKMDERPAAPENAADQAPVAARDLAEQDRMIAPEGLDVRALLNESGKILTAFLTAKNLQERLPLIETQTPPEELASGILAGPLPEYDSFKSEGVRFNKIEKTSDLLFNVKFADPKGGLSGHLILVRSRGSQPPKIAADPFLDCFGGRIREFAASPREGTKLVRPLVTVFDFCTVENVPDFANKRTAKLVDLVGGIDITKAYFGRLSPLGEKMERMGMKYGRTAAMTLLLRWNLHEDPLRPFLEVVDVQSLDWDQ